MYVPGFLLDMTKVVSRREHEVIILPQILGLESVHLLYVFHLVDFFLHFALRVILYLVLVFAYAFQRLVVIVILFEEELFLTIESIVRG